MIHSFRSKTSIALIIKSWNPNPKVDIKVMSQLGNGFPLAAFLSKA